jgi:hypothetical protein
MYLDRGARIQELMSLKMKVILRTLNSAKSSNKDVCFEEIFIL